MNFRLSKAVFLSFSLFFCGFSADFSPAAEFPDAAYQVVWDSPSKDWNGTVPLGNGEVGVNAWVDTDGNLNFFISRTDSLDEYGRVVKVGGGKIVINPVEGEEVAVSDFQQVLDVRNGMLTAQYGMEGQEVIIQLWVDPNRPVVMATVFSDGQAAPEFHVDCWRNSPGEKIVPRENADLLWPRRNEGPVEVFPDVMLDEAQAGKSAVGWYHHNAESFGYEENAKIQGMDDFPRVDPLKGRTFGVLVTAKTVGAGDAVRVDEKTLRCERENHLYIFQIAVHTAHPSTPEKWLEETREILNAAAKNPYYDRLVENKKWWNDFWQRSWIHFSPAENPPAESVSVKHEAKKAPAFFSAHPEPLRLGVDSEGKTRFTGKIMDFSVEDHLGKGSRENFGGITWWLENLSGQITDSVNWTFPTGGALSVQFQMPAEITGYMRLLDKVTAGRDDGFLVDVTPDGRVRMIVGKEMRFSEKKLAAEEEYTLRMSFDRNEKISVFLKRKKKDAPGWEEEEEIIRGNVGTARDEKENTAILTQAYILQRYVDTCAGRGNMPAQFNGSIFTVPHEGRPGHADYRQWGTGWWWQNMRLTRYPKFMSGDFDILRVYLEQYFALLPLCEYRVKKYFGHDGAYYPECIYAWGDVFSETYGSTPWNKKRCPLQESGWHKWEWVGGLELAMMMLQYYEYTGDEAFLREKAVPLANSVLTFFDHFYSTDEETGKLVMHPAQALETWWDCTNPAPEVAGLRAVTEKLLALPENLLPDICNQPEMAHLQEPPAGVCSPRTFWLAFQRKIPEIPVWTDENGVKRLAPAEKFASKNNSEVPELYPVFPFRLYSFEKPDAEYAENALRLRKDRGAEGWRQDDIFMAYLGQTEDACKNLLSRARTKHADSRFPAFWGPNYDWIPDQDHGGVLEIGLQSLILQTDGRKIFLFPAFPKKWNVDFKLHAPYNTTVEGRVENGEITFLKVTPEERRADVEFINITAQ